MGLGADNFSTFLYTLSKALDKPAEPAPNVVVAPVVSPGPLASAVSAAASYAAAALRTPSVPDLVLEALAQEPAGLSITKLLAVSPGANVTSMMAVIQQLQSFKLVTLNDGLVQVTEEGKQAVAAAKAA
jgi:hypothetical protein